MDYTRNSLGKDSRLDITWRNAATGDNVVWQMNGTTLSNPQLVQLYPYRNNFGKKPFMSLGKSFFN